MKLTRKIPTSGAGLTAFATAAFNAAQALGAEVDLELNTAPRIAADLYDVNGNPAAGPGPGNGKRRLFDEARAAVSIAQASRRPTVADGRKFCAKAVDALKGYLGRSWNPLWAPVGLLQPSLRIPSNPLPVLIGLREYFRAHADHENAGQNITAARAESLEAAIEAADETVAEKMQARAMANRAHAAALRKLKLRLTGLRHELDQILPDDDVRWRRFGFSRPIDRHLPDEVEGLVLRSIGQGIVIAEWSRSARAKDYRVKWSLLSAPNAVTELPLVHDLSVTIGGLQTGATVIVTVSARNDRGETLTTQAQLAVP